MPSNRAPIAMKGAGYYDLHSQIQHKVIALTVPLIENAVAAVPWPSLGYPFVLVDYGCSEGRNSIAALKAGITAVRRLRPDQPFVVIHDDLPSNNFNRLFSNLYNSGEAEHATAYGATADQPIMVFASGQSFYTQVTPDNSVHLGFSSSSVHWTTNAPILSNHIHHAHATDSEAAEYYAIAKSDWYRFLQNREKELVPGAKLIVTCGARLDEAEDTSDGAVGETHSGQIISELLFEILKQFVQEGSIKEANLRDFTIPIYCRSQEEFLYPFMDGSFGDKFKVEHFEIMRIECPFHMKYLEDGNAQIYAEGLTGIIRGFTEPLILRHLFGLQERRRDQLDISFEQKVANQIYDRLCHAIAATPDKYTFYPIHAVMVFGKNG